MVLAVVAVSLSGCSISPAAEPDEVATYQASGGMDAVSGGVLVRDGGCLYVESPDDEDRYLPVLPDDVAWDGEHLEHDGRSYALGDDVTFGGGEVDLEGYTPTNLHIPERCVGDGKVWLVSPG